MTINRYFCYLFLVTFFFCFSSCTKLPYQKGQAQKDVKDIQNRLNSIQVATEQIHIVSSATYRADISALLTEIKEQLIIFQHKIDATDHRIKNVEKLLLNSQKRKRTKKKKHSPPKASIHIEKTYHQAREDYITGNYKLALKGFKKVLRQPIGSYTEQSIYWSAESYYKLKQYKNAIKYYLNVTRIYPKGQKLCATLYKIGKVLDKQNKHQDKINTWKQLVNTPQCKNSNEVLRIKNLL